MAKKRPAVLRKEKERAARIAHQRKVALDAIGLMGIKNEFNKLPKITRDSILARKGPPPEIQVKKAVMEHQYGKYVFFKITSFFTDQFQSSLSNEDEPDEELRPLGDMTPSDFFSIFVPIRKNIGTRHVSEYEADLVEAISESASKASDRIGRIVWRALGNTCVHACSDWSRINDGYFYFKMTPAARVILGDPLVITLHCAKPESIRVELEPRKIRAAWRVGWTKHTNSMWIDLDASLVGGLKGVMYPVYVQEHVFERLKERVEMFASGTHFFLSKSLLKPTVIAMPDDPVYGKQYLLEYKIIDHKVGYILLRVIDEKVIAVTFKFITMLGTPEGEALAAQLRMGKRMMEYNGLHDMRTIMESDLFDDPLVSGWMHSCGLGDLAALREKLNLKGESEAAGELKKFMRIDSRREARLLEEMKEMTV